VNPYRSLIGEAAVAIITTIEELDQLVDEYLLQKEFAFDVETIGDNRDNPHIADVVWISLATGGRSDVIPMGHPNGELIWERPELLKSGQRKVDAGKSREDLRETDFSKTKIEYNFGPPPPQLERWQVFPRLEPLFFSSRLKIGHNIRFDLHAVKKYFGGEYPEGPYYDTLIASWLLDVTRKGKLGLADCVERELGEILVKGIGKDISIHSFDDVAKYSLLDAEYTWRVKMALDVQYHALTSPNTRYLLDLEHEVLHPVLEMESTGVLIDHDLLEQIDKGLREDIDGLQGLIYNLAGRKFNIRSNKHKQEILFGPKSEGGLGLKPLKPTPTAAKKPEAERGPEDWSVDYETLLAYEKVPLIHTMLQHSAKVKLHGTYVLPYLGGVPVRDAGDTPKIIESRLRNGNRLYGQFLQFGTESGRFSSREPNLQNIPSRSEDGKKLRGIFIADPGSVLIVADYSQIEPRIIASLSGDATMIRTYLDGGDVYQAVADRMGVNRPAGKELVLSIAYGVGSAKISVRIGCTVKEARDLMDFFAHKFPSIIQHKNRVISRARRDRYSETIMGRRRPLPRIGWTSQEEKAGAERQAYNHLIQGSAADIMKIALVNIYCELPPEAKMLMTVHDEVVVQAKEEIAEEVADIIKREMEAAKPKIIRVPLLAEVNIAHSWKDGK
jgi:DNA polymerase I-like protein with 3'-5' exonuclease and polymerase domains